MLVLSRKLNEKIIIGEDIEVTVIGIENGSVQLGINAPKNIEILREELLEEVKAENKAALENRTGIEKLKNIELDE